MYLFIEKMRTALAQPSDVRKTAAAGFTFVLELATPSVIDASLRPAFFRPQDMIGRDAIFESAVTAEIAAENIRPLVRVLHKCTNFR